MPGSSRIHGVSLGAGAVTRFTFQDVAAIEKLTDLVRRVNPSVSGRGQVVYASQNWSTQVEGDGVNYPLCAPQSLQPEDSLAKKR